MARNTVKAIRQDMPDELDTDLLLQAAYLVGDHPVLVVEWQTRRILAVNNAVMRVFGYHPQDVTGHTIEFLYKDRQTFQDFGQSGESLLSAGHRVFHAQYPMKRKDGVVFSAEIMTALIESSDGTPLAGLSVIRDLSNVQPPGPGPVELQFLSSNLPGGVFQRALRPGGELSYNFMRGNILQQFGLDSAQAEADADAVMNLIHPEDVEKLRTATAQSLESMMSIDIELRVKTTACEQRYVRSISQPRKLDDGSVIWDGILLDITDQRSAEQHLQYIATHDALTGLHNIHAFDENLENALNVIDPQQQQVLVAALDIDRFQNFNESQGFPFGDLVLKTVADCLRHLVGNTGMAARYHGDEFNFYFSLPRDRQKLDNTVRTILGMFSTPLSLASGEPVSVKINLGLALYPGMDGDTPQNLRLAASRALKQAKLAPDTPFMFYAPEMTSNLIRTLELEKALTRAIAEKRIKPHYQPKYSFADGLLCGFESLARWQDEQGRFIPPVDFIPLAEETGLIHAMEKIYMKQVLSDLCMLKKQGIAVPCTSVNVSVHQVHREGFTDDMLQLIAGYELDVTDIAFEITESVFMFDFKGASEKLHQLSSKGLLLSLDDFGTGYSSLSYLNQLPFSELKIDRTFIGSLNGDTSSQALVAGIINLAHALNLSVVAEGIETAGQLERLRAMNCDIAQGFLLGEPAPVERFTEVLYAQQPHPVMGKLMGS